MRANNAAYWARPENIERHRQITRESHARRRPGYVSPDSMIVQPGVVPRSFVIDACACGAIVCAGANETAPVVCSSCRANRIMRVIADRNRLAAD